MVVLEEHIVPMGTKPVRLSDYVHLAFETIPSRKGGKKAIERGAVRVDGQEGTTGIWVKPGMHLELLNLDPVKPKPFPLEIPILHGEGRERILLIAPAGERYIVDAEGIAGAAVYGAEAIVGVVGDGAQVEGRQLYPTLFYAAIRAGGIGIVDDVHETGTDSTANVYFTIGAALGLVESGGIKINKTVVLGNQSPS